MVNVQMLGECANVRMCKLSLLYTQQLNIKSFAHSHICTFPPHLHIVSYHCSEIYCNKVWPTPRSVSFEMF